ncbi:2'-5' RNA ligase family protein [Candidatus Rickettsiella viridis]|uniref:2'-5' RNA ligase family protein n=1 Tax=Candidatus Rickettsiella viridis TaxID=676208 RepID=UPI001E323E3C|nr:2'-5' RNA ligase family protein [Candidatus Rickettsiella viridis]
MSTHDPLRLFFAIELNKELRDALSKLIDELKHEPWGNRVRWVHPDNLHVTLRFLGPAEPSLIAALAEGTHKAIKKLSLFYCYYIIFVSSRPPRHLVLLRLISFLLRSFLSWPIT